ncbi:MAG: hypothetical protein J6T60_09495 [Bacteroidales bacterium]|nr:hypothetical protein [Bacteroidales bacterium]
MKKNYLTQFVALSLATAALLSSCKKEEYDLDNIGDNIMFSTALGAPLIAERDISFIDFFDMEMEGKFSVTEEESKKIRRALSPDGKNENYHPDCLDLDNMTIDLSKMNGEDLEKLEDLTISFEEKMPSSEDFIEIDDLDKTFGDGNAINEINDFEVRMELDNRSDFQITLSIAFAKTIHTITHNGEIEEKHVPIEGTETTGKINIPAREEGQKSTGMKTYSLNFKNIAQTIKDNKATGMIISYELAKGHKDSFTILPTDGVTMKSVQAFIDATIDLSNINSSN